MIGLIIQNILFLFIIFKALKAYATCQGINVTIKGSGKQQIVNNSTEVYDYKPKKIFVNGILQNYTDYYVYNLTKNINIITMRWDSKLTMCFDMFYNLANITYFNFSNFDTSEVTYMNGMFFGLNSLKTLDLSNFNTSSVMHMNHMFYQCTSLISLNLFNFDISKVIYIQYIFDGCNSLIYLNLNSFIIPEDVILYNNIIPENSDNLLLCYKRNLAYILTSILNGCPNSCENKCFKNESKLIIDNRTCIDKCDNDGVYKYEYKNICFKSCTEISEYLYGSPDYEIYYNYNKSKCIDEIPVGYYLNDTINKMIDKCDIKCKSCNKQSIMNDLCLSCNIENNYYPIINNSSNIYPYINFPFFIDYYKLRALVAFI